MVTLFVCSTEEIIGILKLYLIQILIFLAYEMRYLIDDDSGVFITVILPLLIFVCLLLLLISFLLLIKDYWEKELKDHVKPTSEKLINVDLTGKELIS